MFRVPASPKLLGLLQAIVKSKKASGPSRGCPAPDRDSRLAGLHHRAAEGDRATDQPDGAQRRRCGRLPYRHPASPTAAWIWHQLREATPWDRHPQYLIHDRDAVYGGDFHVKLASLGIASVRTPPRAPTANSVAERIVRTIRTECLDHLIVIDERHLRAVLTEFADYYNRDRPHRSLGLQSPLRSRILVRGRVVSRSVLGGLHHVYARAA